MRFNLDENLPATLVADLATLGHDADTAVEDGLAGSDGDDVWAAAQVAGRVLIT